RERRTGQLAIQLDRTHTADAQQQLLQQSVLAAATVEAVGHAAQRILVLRDVGVQQQELDAADRDLPHAGVQRTPFRQREHDVDGGAIGTAQHRERQAVRIEYGVALLLPALAGDRLAEIAGPVEQA